MGSPLWGYLEIGGSPRRGKSRGGNQGGGAAAHRDCRAGAECGRLGPRSAAQAMTRQAGIRIADSPACRNLGAMGNTYRESARSGPARRRPRPWRSGEGAITDAGAPAAGEPQPRRPSRRMSLRTAAITGGCPRPLPRRGAGATPRNACCGRGTAGRPPSAPPGLRVRTDRAAAAGPSIGAREAKGPHSLAEDGRGSGRSAGP